MSTRRSTTIAPSPWSSLVSFEARVTAKLLGEVALAALLLAFAVLIAWAPIPTWLKGLLVIPTVAAPTFMVLAAGIRHLQGGASDIEIVDGSRKFSVTSVRFGDLRDTIAAAMRWHRPPPMVRPAGTVVGRASDPDALRTAVAVLSASLDIAPSLEVPPDAASISVMPASATISVTGERPTVVERGRGVT